MLASSHIGNSFRVRRLKGILLINIGSVREDQPTNVAPASSWMPIDLRIQKNKNRVCVCTPEFVWTQHVMDLWCYPSSTGTHRCSYSTSNASDIRAICCWITHKCVWRMGESGLMNCVRSVSAPMPWPYSGSICSKGFSFRYWVIRIFPVSNVVPQYE